MILNWIISILVWGAVAISLIRMLNNSGLEIPDGKVKNVFCAESRCSGEAVSARECVKVGIYALLYRIIVYIIAIPILNIFVNGSAISFDGYLSAWQKWDASHYIRIAESWYSYTENGKNLMLVFFPMYSVFIKIFSFIFVDTRLSALVLSTVCYSVACGYIYALVSMDYNKSIAKATLIFLSVFPFSFFFGGIMTESIFLLMTSMTFYYIRKCEWRCVMLCGILSALSRMIGVIMLLPAAVEWCEEYKPFRLIKENKWKELSDCIFKKGLFIVLILIGTGIYLLINYQTTGNAFQFMEYQREHWYHENCYFASTITDIFQKAFSDSEDMMLRLSIWIPSACIFVMCTGLLVYSAFRHKSMYVLYFVAYLVINTSVTWLISAPRYMSVALPMFIILAELTERQRRSRYVIYAVFFALMLVYLTWYFMGRQIM